MDIITCEKCNRYKGDCGWHRIDDNSHIDYSLPDTLIENKCPEFQNMEMNISIPEAIENIEFLYNSLPVLKETTKDALTMAKNSLEAWHNIKARLYAEAKRIDKADTFFTEVWSKAMNKALEIVSYELHKINIEK